MTEDRAGLDSAFYNLRELTECRCIADYKDRGRIDPECSHDCREDVDALAAAIADHAAQLAAKDAEIAAWHELVTANITPGAIVWPNSWPQNVAMIAYRSEAAEQRSEAAMGLLRDVSRYLDPRQYTEVIARIDTFIAGGEAEEKS